MTAIEFQYKLVNLEDSLMRFAYRLTSDKEDSKDLVQDTFLKALKYCDKFVHETNFKAWLFTIMKNTFINNYNRSMRRDAYDDQRKPKVCINHIHTTASVEPDSVYISKEIEKIINSLDDNFKLPFKMHYEGFKYKEIADELGLNLGTVKSRINLTAI